MINVLVSGASGIVGYGILRSLKKSGLKLNLIGATIYQDSVAQGFCDVFELAPPTADEQYMPWLLKTIEKHHVALLIPGIEADMYLWNKSRSLIEKTGARPLLNSEPLIDLCGDKWKFYEDLRAKGFSCLIESSLSNDFKELSERFGLPFLLKPRKGFGAKGIVRIYTAEDFASYKNAIGPVLMAQPIVGSDNEEYTTSAFCDGKGGFYSSMTLRRTLSKEGFTEKAEVGEPAGTHEVVSELANYLVPLGPTNFQFRLSDGKLKLLEINPRISSSTSIRASFGYNESMMSVDYFVGGKVPEQPKVRKGKAVRYTEDFIFYA